MVFNPKVFNKSNLFNKFNLSNQLSNLNHRDISHIHHPKEEAIILIVVQVPLNNHPPLYSNLLNRHHILGVVATTIICLAVN
jgi:hypothetical protein